MFTSSVCKHINKWGKNKGNTCNKPSKKKDSRCHKHRYRFLIFISNIYKSFKYLFDIEYKTINNKKQIKKILEQKEEDLEKLKIEHENILIKKNDETYFQYIDKLHLLTIHLLPLYNKKVIHKLISTYIYKNKPDLFGTRIYVDYSNYYLKTIKITYFSEI